MTYSSVGADGRKKGSVAEVFDDRLGKELFNLLWGQERTAMPSVVDHAYEELWKHVIMIGGSEEQRLSDVTLAEQKGRWFRAATRRKSHEDGPELGFKFAAHLLTPMHQCAKDRAGPVC